VPQLHDPPAIALEFRLPRLKLLIRKDAFVSEFRELTALDTSY
jgi:hypothetical protein